MLSVDDELRARIVDNLSRHDRREHALDGRRHAAVAIVVVDGADAAPAFVLCRRAATLRNHAGQWALPGGRSELDESITETARRETAEEVGLDLGPDAVLGVLDDYPTRSGFVITPVVLWGGSHAELRPDPGEVAAAYRVPLAELMQDDSPRFVTIPESPHPVVQLPLRDNLIHAPTAAVLVQFRWVALEGRIDTRVDTFEQPVFAWR